MSQNICACAEGIFERERKTQYLQTPALERRTKRVIPGFRPVRSLLDAVGPSLLSATDLAPRYGMKTFAIVVITDSYLRSVCMHMTSQRPS